MFKDGRYWPFLIVGLLSISVGANVILILKATSDPAFAVEKDYYQKAVDFDATQKARAESARLGWRVALKAERDRLEVRLFDDAGVPISDATLAVEAFHNARANQIIAGELEPEGPGLYAMNRPFARPGIWEYRLTAVRGEQRYIETIQEEIR